MNKVLFYIMIMIIIIMIIIIFIESAIVDI